jgi:hypothetical protein
VLIVVLEFEYSPAARALVPTSTVPGICHWQARSMPKRRPSLPTELRWQFEYGLEA